MTSAPSRCATGAPLHVSPRARTASAPGPHRARLLQGGAERTRRTFMRWRGLRQSQNVRDLRGRRAGIGIPLSIGGRGGGLGVIILLIIAALVGGPEVLSLLVGDGSVDSSRPAPQGGLNDEAGQFTAAILGSTEDVWGEIFTAGRGQYAPPELTLFDGSVQSACGFASAAVGPFYCPADSRVYLDTAFFDDLARMGGAGDFAQAYVIGHEIGHHIQNL